MTQAAYRITQRVRIEGREGVYTISAAYRVECWYYYELAGLPDFLVRESRLRPADNDKETP